MGGLKASDKTCTLVDSEQSGYRTRIEWNGIIVGTIHDPRPNLPA